MAGAQQRNRETVDDYEKNEDSREGQYGIRKIM